MLPSSSLDFGMSGFDDSHQGWDPERQLHHHRALRGRDVEIDNASKNTCRWMDCLNTTYGGNRIASGVMFSVTAKQTLEILSMEIDHYFFDGDLNVEIFTRPGADYINVFSDPAEWSMVAQTPIIRAPERGSGSIVPRGAFTSIQMATGEILSFYVTLTTQHLRLSDSGDLMNSSKHLTNGGAYVSDDFLQIDMGIALSTFKFPETKLLDLDAAFRGAFHYQAVQSCTALTPTITSMVLKFAVQDGVDVRSSDFSNAFLDFLSTEPQLAEFTKNHGLQIDHLQATDMGVSSVCGNLVVSENCRSHQVSLDLRYYPTLSRKEVELGIYTVLSGQESLFRLESGFDVAYVGDKVLVENFEIVLTGLPQQTILSPRHRRYIEQVTFAFLERLAPVEPYQVEVAGQIFDRRNLRTDLQSTGVVKVEALIYGVGDNPTTFFPAIGITFKQNRDQYLLDLSKEQLRPSDINEFEDLGNIFADLFLASASLSSPTNRTGSFSEPLDDGGLGKEEIQDIIFSVVLGLSCIWLVYRIVMDYFYIKSSERITKVEKLSEKKKKRKKKRKKEEKLKKEPPPKPMSLPKRAMKRSNSFTGPAPVSPTMRKPMPLPKRAMRRSSSFTEPGPAAPVSPSTMEPTESNSDEYPDAPHSWTSSAQPFEASPTRETKAENRSGDHVRSTSGGERSPNDRGIIGLNYPPREMRKPTPEASTTPGSPPFSPHNRSGKNGRGIVRNRTMPERPRSAGINMAGKASSDPKQGAMKPRRCSAENTRPGPLGRSIPKTRAPPASPGVQRLDTVGGTVGISQNNGNIKKKMKKKSKMSGNRPVRTTRGSPAASPDSSTEKEKSKIFSSTPIPPILQRQNEKAEKQRPRSPTHKTQNRVPQPGQRL